MLEPNHPKYPNTRGMYDPNRHIIFLYYEKNLVNKKECLVCLRNEYFSYQIQTRNENNNIKPNQNIFMPFLDAKGEIDEKMSTFSCCN